MNNNEIRYSISDDISDLGKNYLYVAGSNFLLDNGKTSFVRWVSCEYSKDIIDVLIKNNIPYYLIGDTNHSNSGEKYVRIDVRILDLKIKLRDDKINSIIND